jgi:DNA polymerase III, alpha subunit
LGVIRAGELPYLADGSKVLVAGAVIVRQRPGTAKGFFFMSLEDETGISNIIVKPDTFDQFRLNLLQQPFLIIKGILQNQQNSISVRASDVRPLDVNAIPVPSHDFH